MAPEGLHSGRALSLAAALEQLGWKNMRREFAVRLAAMAVLTTAGIATGFASPSDSPATAIDPKSLPRINTIDERFQSYNIEMVEVTGGRFWKPYDSTEKPEHANSNQPAGLDPSLYEYRPPIDLSNPRLRKMASALGPAYLRVSGTWANTTWFQDGDDPAPATAPAGFKGVLTRREWKGVVDFSNAVGAKIVTSFAVSDGVRDAKGAWTPAQAQQMLAFTKDAGGSIAAAEFMNEPTVPQMGGAPKDYDAAAFARDIAAFRAFMKQASPGTLILGPGGVGEGSALMPASMKILKSEDMLAATGPVFDAFSYHTYGAVSSRCGSFGATGTTSTDAALTEGWLQRGVQSEQFYESIRDRFEPGKPMWLTETGQTACGGDRWASTFLDSFRYLNQLGALAKRGVQVHMHNTLAASDYGLLDEKTYEPRPNYWSALLWHRLMGTTVLDAGSLSAPSLHLYAHCLPDHPGGVTLLVINTDASNGQTLHVGADAERYTLTARNLTSKQVQLNGIELKLGAGDSLPRMNGAATRAGTVTFPPASITFVSVPGAKNVSCMK
jgi:heparanase